MPTFILCNASVGDGIMIIIVKQSSFLVSSLPVIRSLVNYKEARADHGAERTTKMITEY
jgi:hypothetical protein